jgi:glycine cleavage system H protein
LSDTEIPEDLHYSREDEWTRQVDDNIVVGITDYAQQQLGDIVFIELPEVGTAIKRGEPFGVIESVKAVSDLYAPISGQVVEINPELADRPESVNESCYTEGWMLSVNPSDASDFEGLLDADGYRRHVDERSE